ncbi:MAG TPA: THUMP domain-containing protein, partial [Burkholderiales bacterium]|nr:THUMP domain-containing protein [Burkholderiales bacterium]
MYKCFATISRGLENLLVNELQTLGANNVNPVKAGALFDANLDTIMQINLKSRVASRILIQVAFGNYQNENDIYDLTQTVKWDNW